MLLINFEDSLNIDWVDFYFIFISINTIFQIRSTEFTFLL